MILNLHTFDNWKLTHSENKGKTKQILTVFKKASRDIKADTQQDNRHPRETVHQKKLENQNTFTHWATFIFQAEDTGYTMHPSCKETLLKIIIYGLRKKNKLSL